MGDLIDREDALKVIYDAISLYGTGNRVESEILVSVSHLPSAERRTMTRDKIDSIRSWMCDGYCKWGGIPVKRILYEICEKCPLNELEASE